MPTGMAIVKAYQEEYTVKDFPNRSSLIPIFADESGISVDAPY
jgi:hypothetical protein